MEFEEIYNAYFKSVYLFALHLSGSEHIAQEITSQTFYKAINAIGSFRGDCEMGVWLCQIAKNAYYSYVKKHKKELSIADTNLQNIPSQDVSLDEQIGTREGIGHIRKILHSMPEPYKEVFMWRVFGDMSFRQIGALFGKTDNWACVTYHRARKMIKSRLEEEDK